MQLLPVVLDSAIFLGWRNHIEVMEVARKPENTQLWWCRASYRRCGSQRHCVIVATADALIAARRINHGVSMIWKKSPMALKECKIFAFKQDISWLIRIKGDSESHNLGSQSSWKVKKYCWKYQGNRDSPSCSRLCLNKKRLLKYYCFVTY